MKNMPVGTGGLLRTKNLLIGTGRFIGFYSEQAELL
jgi:hypothetical protein